MTDQLSAASRTYYMATEQDPAPLRVAIYVRISEDPDDARVGITQQEADCRARAEREGWQVVRVYDGDNDTGASTRTTKKRGDYAAMLEAARRGEFDAILGYSNSRLTRRVREFLDLIELHDKHGIRLLTIVSGDDDLSTADGRAVAVTKATWDQAEAERTGERLKRRQQTNRENGGQGTQRAFGWAQAYACDESGALALRNGKPVRLPDPKHPTEFEALKEALRMVREEGASLGAVARYWNGLGLTTTRGKNWTTTRTRDALVRWRNCGYVIHKGEPVPGLVGSWEPVCTPEELAEVRALLNADGSQPAKRGRPVSALLSGLATCGKCGRRLYSGRQATRLADGSLNYFGVYRCSGSQDQTGNKCWTTIKRESLEAAVTTALVHKQMTARPGEQASPELSRLSSLKAAQRDVQEAIGRLVDAVASGALSGSDVAVKRGGLEREQEALQAEIDAVLTSNAELRLTADLSRSLWTPGKVSLADGKRINTRLRETFEGMDIDQKRTLIRTLPTITVHPKGSGKAYPDEHDKVRERRIQIGDDWS